MNATPNPTLDDIWALFRETDRKFQDTDRQLRELGKQIGGLGNKLGSFTEGLALPSMQKILQQRFGVEIVSSSASGGAGRDFGIQGFAAD